MQLTASDRLLLAAFVALAVSSIGLKAMAGPAHDGWTDQNRGLVVARMRERLASQGFQTSVVPLKIQTPIVVGRRRGCLLSVRDAHDGEGMITQFARDAAPIGPVRYIYRGNSYAAPPALRIRFVRFETEVLRRFTGEAQAHVPVAIATSPGCKSSDDFSLSDVSIAV